MPGHPRNRLSTPELHRPVRRARQEGILPEGIAPNFVNRRGVALRPAGVRFEVLLVVRRAAPVNESVLGADEVDRRLVRGKIDAEAARLSEDDAFLVSVHLCFS